MKATIIGKYLLFAAALAGLILYINIVAKPPKDPEIVKLRQQMQSLDSLNRKIIARDSLQSVQIDSLKASYKKTKTNINRHEKNFDNYRSDIFLPEL